MKVKCINNWLDITIGKTYEVLEMDGNWYNIINDISDVRGYPKKWFKLLSEIRNETINKLLE